MTLEAWFRMEKEKGKEQKKLVIVLEIMFEITCATLGLNA
jgi:hypothetical protein